MKIILALALAVIALSASSEGSAIRSPQVTCSTANCKLPDCFCSNIEVPGGFPPGDIPQIVYLTFDDGITEGAQLDFYNELFNGRKNPNGQNISATFFVTHEYNDYTLTHERWRQGHEIALHSITHKSNTTYWQNLDAQGWREDVVEQKKTMAQFAKIPENEIVGFRAPFLQGGGDVMYAELQNGGFRYESSRPTRILRPVLWPYTADFDTIQDCQIAPCPTQPHAGFWVSPLVDLMGTNGQPCAMVDTCQEAPTTPQETYDLLWKNFQDHYNSQRAPFGIYTHAAWILNVETPWIREGYIKFVDTVLALGDAYIVSITKGLDWVQHPVDLSDTTKLPASWQSGEKTNQCFFAFSCTFETSQLPIELQPGTRYMKSCANCPPRYPWRGNPLGSG